MDRDPPESVKKILRREVNYCCPVPGCGKPFLSWHHFDPPWSVKQHHNPEGMIALCVQCHRMADSGTFSPTQLRNFKQSPNSPESIKEKFPWMPENCIIRLGGCYAPDWCRVSIGQTPILEIKKNGIGLTTVSFVLKKEDDRLLAEMDENDFVAFPENLHDFAVSASANRIKIWSEKHRIGFEFHYSRKSPDEIEKIIQEDAITPDDIRRMFPDFSFDAPIPIDNLREFCDALSEISDLREVAMVGFTRHDPTGTVVRWHVARHIGEDGRIPFLNFISCRFYHAGRYVELKNGRLEHFHFCGGNTFNFDPKRC